MDKRPSISTAEGYAISPAMQPFHFRGEVPNVTYTATAVTQIPLDQSNLEDVQGVYRKDLSMMNSWKLSSSTSLCSDKYNSVAIVRSEQ